MEAENSIKMTLFNRLLSLDAETRRRFDRADQVVVFGSFAVGLEHPKSDLDVFCIGEQKFHFKSPDIEILMLPEHDAFSEVWLTSELANHIVKFGFAANSRPDWYSQAYLDERAASRKRRRIEAYLASLEVNWDRLGRGAKTRYQIRVRRELQRLALLDARVPVPPTALLDEEYKSKSKSIYSELWKLLPPAQQGKMTKLFSLTPQ